jgi:hypothetical protein
MKRFRPVFAATLLIVLLAAPILAGDVPMPPAPPPPSGNTQSSVTLGIIEILLGLIIPKP